MPLRSILLVAAVGLLSLECSEEFAHQPQQNAAPETYLYLNPDAGLRRTSSQQHIRWWAIDQDGFVRGFLFSFDSVSWHYTRAYDSLFALQLNRTDTTYRFFVSAFDDASNGVFDASTPFGPEPFDDENGNGVFDAGESFVDFGQVDMSPASIAIPIQNSPPSISFILNTDVPDTTYPVASFQWTVSDFDGNETIDHYTFALDDTSSASDWRTLPGGYLSLTLFRNKALGPLDPANFRNDSLTEGNHALYLRAHDIAGAVSSTIRMPADGGVWYVKEPKGDFLVIDDYSANDLSATFYGAMFDTLMGGRLMARDIIDIKRGASAVSRGDLVPALINPTFTETLKLFKYVFWYADNGPSLEIAQSSLPEFQKGGGKVLFSSGFPENVTAQGSLVDFAPIENVEAGFFTNRLNQGDTLVSVPGGSYPDLIRDNLGTIYAFPRGVLPKVNARILYRMQVSTRWTGQPIMGVKDADQATFVLFAGLLHRFGTPPDRVATFLRTVFQTEFGVQP